MTAISQDLQDYQWTTEVIKDTFQTCFYGFCLLRIIHIVAATRIKFPLKLILIGKTDLNNTYQRIHANAKIASTCISSVRKLAFLFLCLPFGTTPAPEECITIIEAESDLVNDFLADTSWDATNRKSLHRHVLSREEYLPASDPIVKSDQLAVNIKAK